MTATSLLLVLLLTQLPSGTDLPAPGSPPAEAFSAASQALPDNPPLPASNPAGSMAPSERPLVDIGSLPGAPGAGRASAIKSPASGDTPTDLVARALQPPQGTRLAGRPLSLLTALAAVRDAQQQRAVIHAYWDTVALVARYNIRWRALAILDRFDPRPGDELATSAARASAAAAVVEAEIATIGSQHALAEHAFLSFPSADLPLPSDRPCAGPYETRYEQVFARRPAPARAWLIDRTLPLRREAIDRRAGAVAAAQQAFVARQRAYQLGSSDLASVLAALAAWTQQEDALMRNVRDYNNDIADYATEVQVGPTDIATLVSMLIGPQPLGEPAAPMTGPLSAGIPTTTPSPWAQPIPTLAPPEGAVRPAGNVEPLPARASSPPREAAQPRQLDDELPGLLPINGQMAPTAPNRKTAPVEEPKPTEPKPTEPKPASDEDEAPKVLVVPAEAEGQPS